MVPASEKKDYEEVIFRRCFYFFMFFVTFAQENFSAKSLYSKWFFTDY